MSSAATIDIRDVMDVCPDCSPENNPWYVTSKEMADALFKHIAEHHVRDMAAAQVNSLITGSVGRWRPPDWYPSWMHGFAREQWEKTLYEHKHNSIVVSRVHRPGSSHLVKFTAMQVMFPTEARRMARTILKAIKGWRDFDTPPYTLRGMEGFGGDRDA